MNIGHGHVLPREDGVIARCGGPALCQECAKEKTGLEILDSPDLREALNKKIESEINYRAS